jgi:hypothetical protein
MTRRKTRRIDGVNRGVADETRLRFELLFSIRPWIQVTGRIAP